jgi:hypothetical protein
VISYFHYFLVTFQMIATGIATTRPMNPDIPGEQYTSDLIIPTSTGVNGVSYIAREMGESVPYTIPTPAAPKAFSVLPGTLFIE